MGRKLWGILLVGLGILFLMQQLGEQNLGLSLGPVVLAVAGGALLVHGISHRSWSKVGLGLWVGAAGLFDILNQAGITTIGGGDIWRQGWPILLIGLGLAVLTGNWRGMQWRWEGHGEGGQVGDFRYGREPWLLEGDLEIKHGAGDLQVDLTTAQISDGDHRIRVKQGAGEMLIRVPDNVDLTVEAKVGMGDLQVLDDRRSGVGMILKKRHLALDSPIHLILSIKLGMGQVRVVAMRVPDSPLT